MGSIYKSTKECFMWLGQVNEEPIEDFCPFESWIPTELNILKGLVQDQQSKIPGLLPVMEEASDAIDVPSAFKIMDMLAENKHFHEMPFYRITPSGDFRLCQTWSKAVYSLENIARRMWWGRIWTAQEAFLPSRAIILVGPYSQPYQRFVDGADAWFRHGLKDLCCSPILESWSGYHSEGLESAVVRILELKKLRVARSSPHKEGFAHNLFLLSLQRSATLRHDHIYGIYGLASEFFQLDLEPDYSLGLAELYAAITIMFMETTRHLCLLPYARPQFRGQSEANLMKENLIHDLPSWTPDWSATSWGRWGVYFDICNNGGFTADKMHSYSGEHMGRTKNVLKLKCIPIGTVPVVGRLIKDMKVPPAEFVPVVQEWLDMAAGKGLPPRTLWEIMHVATHNEVGMDRVDFQEAWWEVLKGLAGANASFEEMRDAAKRKGTSYQICVGCMGYLDERAVFLIGQSRAPQDMTTCPDEISEFASALPHGSIGLALPGVQAGDLVFTVKGGRAPLIMRPLSDPRLRSRALEEGIPKEDLSKCFTFVGVSYVYGAMRGQTVAENRKWQDIFLF